LIITQLENAAELARGPAGGLAWGVAARLPLLQAENLVVAGALAALWTWTRRSRAARFFQLALVSAHLLYLAFDQLVFRLAHAHLSPRLNEGAIAASTFRDSLFAELDGWLALNACLAAGLVAWVAWRMLATPAGLAQPRVGWGTWRWLAGWAVAGIFVSAVSENFAIDEHPWLAFARGAWPGARSCATTGARARLPRLSPAVFRPETAGGARAREAPLASAGRRFRQAHPRPNVVLVVLESVGALELAGPDGLPSSEVAPTLRWLAESGIFFDAVYARYPATAQSHLTLATGGLAATWASLGEAIECRYEGPSLQGALKRAGYATGLFSAQALGDDTLGKLYRGLGGFDRIYDFGTQPVAYQLSHEVHSWGGDENYVGAEALKWLDTLKRGQPFFLELLTVSTHHPYLATGGETPRERYRAALRYTDSVVKKLLGNLVARGLADNTIVVVTGDHGEAFGLAHPGVRLHKDHLYEEIMRGFLLVGDLSARLPPARSSEPASEGDIAPTVAALAGAAGGGAWIGQDLLAPDARPRIVFFNKGSPPERCGLRDGRFKYVVGVVGRGADELYDLERDPGERVNLVATEPERASRYRARCLGWFEGVGGEYVRRLRECRALSQLCVDEKYFEAAGPRSLAVGLIADGFSGEFVPGEHLSNAARPTALATWLGATGSTEVSFDWVAPGGGRLSARVRVPGDIDRLRVEYPGSLPLESGAWRVELIDRSHGAPHVLLSRGFVVGAAGIRGK
ncbi:MAG: sulfatase-like hydrolase/transferase, partial [Deltaproteobacteria bacterium]|nr:sulfatase-like hydrolase/transferase [Deltaproteobacteria bacterium]